MPSAPPSINCILTFKAHHVFVPPPANHFIMLLCYNTIFSRPLPHSAVQRYPAPVLLRESIPSSWLPLKAKTAPSNTSTMSPPPLLQIRPQASPSPRSLWHTNWLERKSDHILLFPFSSSLALLYHFAESWVARSWCSGSVFSNLFFSVKYRAYQWCYSNNKYKASHMMEVNKRPSLFLRLDPPYICSQNVKGKAHILDNSDAKSSETLSEWKKCKNHCSCSRNEGKGQS